ncbi:MAG: nucleotide exchange factor GrpE [Phycisphaeraceae bacterium]|nr:nucleotide exchange factor GrpE [Phycisphaeraceae bacterium]
MNESDPIDESAPQQQPEPVDENESAEVTLMRQQRDDFEARYLQSMADYQNLARRSRLNEQVAREQTVLEMARQLVTVLDHFDHALAVDVEKTAAGDVLRGVAIVRDELLRVLAQFGVERLDVAAGEEFDPNKHEAMMRQPHEQLTSNQVIQQLQPGYVLADKTLRPAKVSVAE